MTATSKNKEKALKSKVVHSPYFEVHPKSRGVQVIIIGAIGISELDNSKVLVKCHGVKIEIYGSKLSVSVLERNALEIVGEVEDIKIVNARN